MQLAFTLRSFVLALFALLPAISAAADEYAAARANMVEIIEGHAGPPLDPRVLAVMRTIPRHEFVPPEQRPHAYEDRPLPIGQEQTISQPYIVALMTSLLDVQPDDVVLEIGTGSGYQAAVLARLAERVYTIEIVLELGQSAARLLAQSYPNVATRIGDGFAGWPEAAPFDGILVTAAAPEIPPPLLAQLAPGGRMVIPLGAEFAVQNLVLVEKDEAGRVTRRPIIPVRFVPLTRER